MQKTVEVKQLISRMNHAQIDRFNHSKMTLHQFMDQDEEQLITEAIAVLTRLMRDHPVVTFTW